MAVLVPVLFGRESDKTTVQQLKARLDQQESERNMPIGNAVQNGSVIYIYDERGRRIAFIPAGTGPKDGLTGYTSNRVNVRQGQVIYSYDERGRRISASPAR